MIREIKFRAWHKERKKYLLVISLNFYTQLVCVGKPYDIEWISFNDVILEQYTGLKDKNGVEIYEGDIVYTTKRNHFVLFDEGLCAYKLMGDKYYKLFDSDCCGDYEVIGNIHENKELL